MATPVKAVCVRLSDEEHAMLKALAERLSREVGFKVGPTDLIRGLIRQEHKAKFKTAA